MLETSLSKISVMLHTSLQFKINSIAFIGFKLKLFVFVECSMGATMGLILFGIWEFKEIGVVVGVTVWEKFINLIGALGSLLFGIWEYKEIGGVAGVIVWEKFSNLIGALGLLLFGNWEFKEIGGVVGATDGEKFSNLIKGALGFKFFGIWEFKKLVCFFWARAESKGTNKGSENFLERGFSTEVNNLRNLEEFLKDLFGFRILFKLQNLINFKSSFKTLGDFSSWKK